MQKDILGGLFGGHDRLKIIKLFVCNPLDALDIHSIARRANVDLRLATKEIVGLTKLGFLKKHSVYLSVEKKIKGKFVVQRIKEKGWVVNDKFSHRKELEELFIKTNPVNHEEISKKMQVVGRVKLIITAGVFIRNPESRLDLLVVCDKVAERSLDRAVHYLESLMGKEIKYTAMETADFQYRHSMRDKLIRDVLDYPHEVVIDRLGVTT